MRELINSYCHHLHIAAANLEADFLVAKKYNMNKPEH